MLRVEIVLATLMLASPLARSQPSTATPPAGYAFAVAYVEVRAAAAAEAQVALERYGATVRREPGCLAVELFERMERPGHFAVVETWRDRAAFDARDQGAKRALMTAIEPIRVSGYDERPYQALRVALAEAVAGGVFVITHVDVAPNTAAPELLARLAEASRAEPGNRRFDVIQHATRGNHFTVVEGWQSAAAHDSHVAAAHTREYRDALQPLTGSPLDERLYTALAPRGR